MNYRNTTGPQGTFLWMLWWQWSIGTVTSIKYIHMHKFLFILYAGIQCLSKSFFLVKHQMNIWIFFISLNYFRSLKKIRICISLALQQPSCHKFSTLWLHHPFSSELKLNLNTMESSLNVTLVKCVHSNTGNYKNYKPDLFKNLTAFQMRSLWQSWFPIKANLPHPEQWTCTQQF